jgi:hypothetical protein
MIEPIKQFITDRFCELTLTDGSVVYNAENVFFYNMERDFLKDNDYAVLCFFPQDRKKTDGSLKGKERDLEAKTITYTRKIYKRTILARILIYSIDTELAKLCEDFEQNVAGIRNMADSNNNNIKITLQDMTRPWDDDRKYDRLRKRSHCAIAKVQFEGGIYTTKTVSLIPGLADITIK